MILILIVKINFIVLGDIIYSLKMNFSSTEKVNYV